MTSNDVHRAALAMFAARTAGPLASLEQMKGIAYCVRNRVKAGWYDAQWLSVMEHAHESEANSYREPRTLDPNDRTWQRLIADIDDIYYGGRNDYAGARVEETRMPAQRYVPDGGDLEQAIGKSYYWCWINQPFTAWFKENILERPDEHPNRAQMGMMAFFE